MSAEEKDITHYEEDFFEIQDPEKLEKYRLELIIGPMNSGKSTEIRRRMRIKSTYKTTMGVSTKEDIRYGLDGIITHDGDILALHELKTSMNC